MKAEQCEVGLVVRSRRDGQRGVIASGVETFSGVEMVVVKMGKRGVPRMEAIVTLEPEKPNDTKGEKQNA